LNSTYITNIQQDWLKQLNDTLPSYLERLASPNRAGRFYPCEHGALKVGKKASLGFSCFALKLYHTLGLWEKLPLEKQRSWLEFIKSFQVHGRQRNDPVTHNAFMDQPLIAAARRLAPLKKRFLFRFFPPLSMTKWQEVILAETKQAIATLAEVNQAPDRPFLGFPMTEESLRNRLYFMDWNKPWASGGQAAALVVFLKTQTRLIQPQAQVQRSLAYCDKLYESLADKQSGAYFRGARPNYGELINGAMKVLTALDWLDTRIHYPEKLIDTTLQSFPSHEGCHLVDAIYVLYRCLQQTEHRKNEVRAYCAQLLDMIKRHYYPDNGFSYYIDRSQTDYYGVPITEGRNESDIHGTSLLTWAVAMTAEILEINAFRWKIIKP
jgi:hypothetical protein